MKFSKQKQFVSVVLCLVITAVSAVAQTTRPDFNRSSTFDVQHYVLRVSFDRSGKKVNGDTTVVLKPLADGFKEFDLDAVGLSFESIKLDPSAVDLKYNTATGTVKVTLDRGYSAGETIAVRFKYTATPKKGIYFVNAVTDANRVNHSAQIWTQGEPDEARHWFPSFDFPSDKATSEEYITAPSNETVIGNGEFLGKTDNGDATTTWHFKMPVPHSTYLVSFVIGEYARIDDKAGEIPLGFYVYPGKESTGSNAFAQTKGMIPAFEELTGVKFPFNKYDQTIVASFQFGGMENITATTMADTEIFWGDFEFGRGGATDLVSHELAHSWFGNLVTCRNWAELWLNEGFATYMEAAYREKINGRADYMRKVMEDAREFLADNAVTRRRHGLYNLRAGDVDKLFDTSAVTYNKGGVVLHMLREQVGTENFWKAVNAYLNRHKFGGVESTDLRAAMEQASGQDLGWFFDQWVYSSGAPQLTVRPVYSARSKTLKLTVTQTQKPDGLVPAAFRLPLDVAIDGAKMTAPLVAAKRIETFSIKGQARPATIDLDPDNKIPAKIVRVLPVVYVR